MKKSVIYLFFFLIISIFKNQSAHAQFSIGPIAGFGLTSYNELNGAALSYGLAAEYDCSKHIVIHTGMIKSTRYVGGLLARGNVVDNWELDQYFVPLTVKLKTSANKVEPFFNIGVTLGLLRNADYYVDGWNEGPEVEFNQMETDLVLGAGLKIKLENVNLSFELQNRRGLNDLTTKEDEINLRVNTFELLQVGVTFPL